MRRDLRTGAAALLILTVILGLGYPLALTGISQAVFGNRADGSRITRDGRVVGSKLLGQDFSNDPSYFQSRPSATGYSGDVTYFSNLGPNSRKLARQLTARVDAYLKLEGPYTPGLTRSEVPPDAVMTSASGVDPQISIANARIQANRVAAERNMPVDSVLALIDDNTDGRALGFLGEPGVNVLELNLALDGDSQ
jgi:K+-transporting ATPase ATPase C chain